MIQNILLQNGVRLISEPVENTKIASIGFWFPYGSRYEKEGSRGTAHFIEHMLFKGTHTRSAFDIAREFDRVGGYVNAFTEREMVCLHCVVPADFAVHALRIFCDMTVNSLFDSCEFEREREVIESEVIAAFDDPEDASQDGMLQAVYPHSELSYPIAGSVSDVRLLDRLSVIDLYQRHFLYGPLTITAAGCIQQDIIAEIASQMLPQRRSSSLMPLQTPQWRDGLFFLPADFQQTQLLLSYPVSFPLVPADYAKWCVVDSVVGDTMSSRLFQSLREKSGLCYTVYSSFSFARDAGVWTSYASFPPDKTEAVISSLLQQIDMLVKDGITEQELRDAVDHLQGEITLSAEDMEYRMKRLARQFYFSGTLCTCETESREYGQWTGDDIHALITQTFNHQKKALVLAGQRKKVPHGFCVLKKNKDGYYE